MSNPILSTHGLRRDFGGIVALHDVNLQIETGAITGLIGPNGAGKTTCFNCITGLDNATSGEVTFKGVTISGLPAYQINRLGIARTFQNLRLFKDMTVFENVMVARHRASSSGALLSLLRLDHEEKLIKNASQHWLERLELWLYRDERAEDLPYGLQKRLEIARAMATEPSLLFLDEPAAGLNPTETESLMAMIRQFCNDGLTIVIIEHDMHLIMNICEQIKVINFGEMIAQGPPDHVRKNPLVIEAYLGKEREDSHVTR